MTYTFPSKIKSREDIILSLPQPTNQYWTLCADHTEKGKLAPYSELDHLVKENFIKVDQFHGIDYEEAIIDNNREVIPEAHWFHGDMRAVLAEQHHKGYLNPSIVNVDLVWGPKRSLEYLRRILCLLRGYDTIVLCNFGQDLYSKHTSLDQVHDLMGSILRVELQHWKPFVESYTYPGRCMTTQMRTFIFSK